MRSTDWARHIDAKPKYCRASHVAMRSLVFIVSVQFMFDGLGETHGVSLAKPALPPRGRKVLTTNEPQSSRGFSYASGPHSFPLEIDDVRKASRWAIQQMVMPAFSATLYTADANWMVLAASRGIMHANKPARTARCLEFFIVRFCLSIGF